MDLIRFEKVYLTSRDQRDSCIAIVTFLNPVHVWSAKAHQWGTRFEEHRFSPPILDQLESALDRVDADPAIVGLIATGEGKYFSNGVDTEFIRAHIDQAAYLQRRVETVMSRILCMGVVTVAVLNGHATAAGGLFALCFDFRLMAERGLFFLPAVDLGIVYSHGFVEIVKAKVADPNMHRDMLLLSKRYDSGMLENMGVIQRRIASEKGLEEAVDFIRLNWKVHRDSLAEVKRRMYAKAISELTSERISDMHWGNLLKSRI